LREQAEIEPGASTCSGNRIGVNLRSQALWIVGAAKTPLSGSQVKPQALPEVFDTGEGAGPSTIRIQIG